MGKWFLWESFEFETFFLHRSHRGTRSVIFYDENARAVFLYFSIIERFEILIPWLMDFFVVERMFDEK